LQYDDVLAFEHRLKFFHAVEIDDGASADAKKGFGIELKKKGSNHYKGRFL
jgi:hypothetical protein